MKTNNYKIFIGTLLMFICLSSNAQTDKKLIRHGNTDFKNGKYSDAEVNYRKSLDKKYSHKAQFNLGDALYEQKNFAEADRIRDELKARGIEIIDTPQGSKWRKV